MSEPVPEDQKGDEPPPGGGVGAAALRHTRRVVVTVVGATVLALGGIMLVTPGPGFVVLLAGLSVLGLEFAWARRMLRRAKISARMATRKLTR